MHLSDKHLDDARESGKTTYEHMCELLRALENSTNDNDRDANEQEIHEWPLSVLVRDGWRQPGTSSEFGAEEFEILLSTGGPAVRVYGELANGRPNSAEIQIQDWGTPWVKWVPAEYDEKYSENVLAFACWFWFGDE